MGQDFVTSGNDGQRNGMFGLAEKIRSGKTLTFRVKRKKDSESERHNLMRLTEWSSDVKDRYRLLVLGRRGKSLIAQPDTRSQPHLIQEKAVKTHPHVRKKRIVGYCGHSVGAGDIFRFRKRKPGESFSGTMLHSHSGMSRRREYELWRRVIVTIEIVDDGETTK